MIEIRYRAWDSVQGVMLPVECINFREGTVTLNEGDNSVTDTLEMFQLMQYIGLKDKNGKEIYEDDIIQIKDHPFEGAIKIDNNYRVSFNERMELCAGSWLLHRVLYCSEVIGTIWEHPHLLEGRDEA
ncbi:YopX family protein [Paenibacillus sp. ACRRY]|uniref:YopX family protein n=1 Tax=Paenibacillus sp. ACRRY TaxID=2918208 RepID=UPI001EF7407B|nr:YopX family protein [Paenibacillus sp. ACRRY]MCG7385080.1 YopX family protein [Paenibacillus sp. ACRRY]